MITEPLIVNSKSDILEGYTHLIFTAEFDEPLDDLPNGIKIIEIYRRWYEHSLDFLPASLEELLTFHYWGELKNLPPNLKVLGINEEHDNEIIVPEGCQIIHFFKKKGEWLWW